jgi:hypothetical protein
MTQVIKFPDMRPPSRGGPVRELPGPAQFRRTTPAVLEVDHGIIKPRIERKRRLMWFGIAVGMHAALFLGIWLSPPLRLKWNPSPDAWVPVVSLPKAADVPAATPAPPVPGETALKAQKAPSAKARSHAGASVESLPEKAK